MPSARPDKYPEWDTNLINVSEPAAGLRQNGYATDAVPTSANLNWQENRTGAWIRNIDERLLIAPIVAHQKRNPAVGYAGFFTAATFGAGMYCIGGTGGQLQTSPDGDVWTTSSALPGGYLGDINGLCFGAGVFVAVGQAGGLFTSPDGATWTQRTPGSGFSGFFSAVCFSSTLSLFVAVGNTGELQTSPNGTTWTRVSLGTTDPLRAVHFANGLFVAVGHNSKIYTSANGAAWTQRTSAVSAALLGVAFGDGLWVIVGAGVQTSTDAINWTQRAFDGAGAHASNAVAFCADVFSAGVSRFVAVGNFGAIQVSADGISWVTAQRSRFTPHLYAAYYNGGELTFVGQDGAAATIRQTLLF